MATQSTFRLDLALGTISFEEYLILMERLREKNGRISPEEYDSILEKIRRKKNKKNNNGEA